MNYIGHIDYTQYISSFDGLGRYKGFLYLYTQISKLWPSQIVLQLCLPLLLGKLVAFPVILCTVTTFLLISMPEGSLAQPLLHNLIIFIKNELLKSSHHSIALHICVVCLCALFLLLLNCDWAHYSLFICRKKKACLKILIS